MTYILAIDQGTTSCRAIVFDDQLNEISKSQKEFTQIYPQPGWVEHDPEEIWQTQFFTCHDAIAKANILPSSIACIGITNQRETAVVWDKRTGKPVYNAIVWQDKRTAGICEQLMADCHEEYIGENTGLVIDAYFSATKIKWILDHVEGAKEKARKGELLCGTIDSWLIWKLTNGKVHATDYSNASRTLIYNVRKLTWDAHLLDVLNIPSSLLPAVRNSSDDYGTTELFGATLPVYAVAGDQQAALFGQRCFLPGDAKNTYGTGCFMLMSIGEKFISSKSRLLTTIAWGINHKIEYALEGSVFIAGAVVHWLRDESKMISSAEETEKIAQSVSDNGGVYFIPAFTGLGAPHWNMHAKGTISGLTRGTGKAHVVRAALESIAYQTRDVLEAMNKDSGIKLKQLKVDGGASSNNWLMQFQSDILQVPVIRPANLESTARGVAMLAGLKAGLFDMSKLKNMTDENLVFKPRMGFNKADELYDGWRNVIKKMI